VDAIFIPDAKYSQHWYNPIVTTERSTNVNKPIPRITARGWFVRNALALTGQITWAVENSWFNTFVYNTITYLPEQNGMRRSALKHLCP